MDFLDLLQQKLPDTRIKRDEPMSKHTAFAIGGPVKGWIRPASGADVPEILRIAAECEEPLRIIGNGSNILVSDRGVDCCVLQNTVGTIDMPEEGVICAQSGCSMKQVAMYAREHALTGLEFMHGIPGSVGGGVYMNAGAYGGDCSQVVVESCWCDRQGKVHTVCGEEHGFGYRKSIYDQMPDAVILSVTMKLRSGESEQIRKTMEDLAKRRREKQPLEYPSAGSTFKRPEGYFAGKLIEDCGLKGFQIGGAQISEKHAGFIVNRGGATCEDVRRLIAHTQQTVLQRFGVTLECEVIYWE